MPTEAHDEIPSPDQDDVLLDGGDWDEQHPCRRTLSLLPGPRGQLHASAAEREAGELTSDMCVLDVKGQRHYFLRGHIEIPVINAPDDVFSWSPWVPLSQESMEKMGLHLAVEQEDKSLSAVLT